MSLISQKHIMIKHTLFFPFLQNSVNRQETTKITRMDYDKNINNYNYHNIYVQH